MSMKKILLSAVLLTACFTTKAQVFNAPATWTQTLAPVDIISDMGNLNVALDKSGNVFRSFTYSKDLTIGQISLPNEDAIASPAIVKYDKSGKALWAVSLMGAATVRNMTTDDDGNLYIVGTQADNVVLGSTNGATKTVTGLSVYGEFITSKLAAFVAKYDANGVLIAVRDLKAVTDPEVDASFMYIGSWIGEPSLVEPFKVVAYGDKVYVGLTTKGDFNVDNIIWEGRYIFMDGMYSDVPSMGVVSFDAADLTNAKSELLAAAKNLEVSAMYNPDALNFDVNEKGVYAAVFGVGELSFITPKTTAEASFHYSSDAREHGMVFVNSTTGATKIYNAPVDSATSPNYSIAGFKLEGDSIYIAGTSAASNPLDGELKTVGATNVFVAKLATSDFSILWAVADAYDEGDVLYNKQAVNAMVVNKGEVFLSTYAEKTSDRTRTAVLNYDVKADGTLTESVIGNTIAFEDAKCNANDVAVVFNNQLETSASLYQLLKTGIAAPVLTSAAVSMKSFDLQGRQVSKVQKGIYIIKGKKVLVK